jgi:hypothetical protein
MKKKTTVTYPVYASWIHKGKKYSYTTQLYQVGVYVIFSHNAIQQAGVKPEYIKKLYDQLVKDEKSGEITELNIGRMITVGNLDGLLEEITDANK